MLVLREPIVGAEFLQRRPQAPVLGFQAADLGFGTLKCVPSVVLEAQQLLPGGGLPAGPFRARSPGGQNDSFVCSTSRQRYPGYLGEAPEPGVMMWRPSAGLSAMPPGRPWSSVCLPRPSGAAPPGPPH